MESFSPTNLIVLMNDLLVTFLPLTSTLIRAGLQRSNKLAGSKPNMDCSNVKVKSKPPRHAGPTEGPKKPSRGQSPLIVKLPRLTHKAFAPQITHSFREAIDDL